MKVKHFHNYYANTPSSFFFLIRCVYIWIRAQVVISRGASMGSFSGLMLDLPSLVLVDNTLIQSFPIISTMKCDCIRCSNRLRFFTDSFPSQSPCDSPLWTTCRRSCCHRLYFTIHFRRHQLTQMASTSLTTATCTQPFSVTRHYYPYSFKGFQA